jgi:polyisoprenyl-teichoic acid--peptidoglycan teichoic acid transferase
MPSIYNEFPSYNNQDFEVKKNSRKKRFSLPKILAIVLIISSLFFLGTGAYYGYKLMNAADTVVVCEDGTNNCNNNIFGDVFGNIVKPKENVKVKGQDEGRTNFLFIGLDQEAGLADTIMIASLFHKEKKVVTINIPRDFYVSASYQTDSGKTLSLREKINAIYPYAQRDSTREGAGAKALADFISLEFGIPIHYWATTDFRGVESVVDQLGGINIDVPNGFKDCEFPSDGYQGYIRPCPVFKAGSTDMNGETSLIYARSRKGDNNEGSDFARSKRQSIVVQAIAVKAKQKGIFGNINNINSYLDILKDYTRTNITPNEALSFYNQFESVDLSKDFFRYILDDGGPYLCTSDLGAGYTLVYCGGGIPGTASATAGKKRIQTLFQNLLIESQSKELLETPAIFLGNDSNDTILAQQSFIDLGFKSTNINNNYSSITPATKTSKEQITVYITDPILYSLFEQLPKKPDLKYELKSELTADKTLPKAFAKTKIVVWVE